MTAAPETDASFLATELTTTCVREGEEAEWAGGWINESREEGTQALCWCAKTGGLRCNFPFWTSQINRKNKVNTVKEVAGPLSVW